MTTYKFLSPGAVAPFTGFAWPTGGAWVEAPGEAPATWIHACRPGDLPYWLAEELWRVELAGPRHEARYQVAAPRGRLLGRVDGWEDTARQDFAAACAWRARDLALPHLPPRAREALAEAATLEAVSEAVRWLSGAGAAPQPALLAADAARLLGGGPGATAFIAATQAARTGGGLEAFERERAWQARWLSDRLGLPAR